MSMCVATAGLPAKRRRMKQNLMTFYLIFLITLQKEKFNTEWETDV
jgi:hypothetical protein